MSQDWVAAGRVFIKAIMYQVLRGGDHFYVPRASTISVVARC